MGDDVLLDAMTYLGLAGTGLLTLASALFLIDRSKGRRP